MQYRTLSGPRFTVKLARIAGSTVAWTLRTSGRGVSEAARTQIARWDYVVPATDVTTKVTSTCAGLFGTISRRSTSTQSTTLGRKPGRTGA